MQGKSNPAYEFGDVITETNVVIIKPRGHPAANEKGVAGTGSDVIGVDPYKRYRLGKQIILVVIWICIGMAGEIVGPTLPDLKDRLGVNYEEVAQVLVGKSFGMMGGAVLGGFINELFNHHVDLIMAGCLVLMSIAASVTPFSSSVILTAAMFAVNGFAEGIINTGGNAMVIHLWGESTASPMHSLHFGFGLGALIAPQVARPFLSADALTTDDDVTTSSPMTTSPPNVTEAVWVDTSRIEIPYCIIAGVIFLFSLILCGLYLKGPPSGFKLREPNTKFRKMISPASCAYGHTTYGVQLLICLFFYYIQAVGGERAYGKFLFSFAIDSDIKMRKSDATNLQTAFWASFTAGRLLGVPLSQIFSVRQMIIGDITGNILVATILSLFGHQEVMVLWVGSCLMGLFIAVVFPNGMSWANLRLEMNSMAIMLLMMGGSAGDFAYQYLAGYLLDRDTRSLMYVMIGFATGLALIFFLMELVVRLHRGRLAGDGGVDCLEDVEKDVKIVYAEENIVSYL